jgi:hypothetical protein
VNAFVLPREERNATFGAIDDFNIASAMPIFSVGDDRFLLLEQYTLEQSLYESPFYWMCGDLAYLDIALQSDSRPRRPRLTESWLVPEMKGSG